MKKKFIGDAILNIVATALPLIFLQIISMPLIAKQEGPESYGTIVVVISILTLLAFPIGNALNNIRLLKNSDYQIKNIDGDFAPVLMGSSITSIIIFVTIALWFLDNLTYYNVILQTLIVIGMLLKDYWIVTYRIKLNFKGILFNNIFLALGYLIGTIFYYFIGYWEIIYLIGLVFSLLYIVMTSDIWRDPIAFSNEFNSTFLKFLQLYISSILGNFITYADKILLLPILGPVNVAIYYSATIIGKMLSMIFGPVNSVLLSYLTKVDRITNKTFIKGFIMILAITIVGYIFTISVSPSILFALYPEWAQESLELIYITTATTYISILSSLFRPFNLRYNKIKWQLYINGSDVVLYVIVTIFLTNQYGLTGFAISVLISRVYIFVLQLLVFVFNKPSHSG